MINMIIKGDVYQAHAALTRRQIVDFRYRGATKHGETVWTTPHDWQNKDMADWLCDGPQEAPYPPGTLLFYHFNA